MDFRNRRLWILIAFFLMVIILGACQAALPTSLPVITVPIDETLTPQAVASVTPTRLPTETQEAALAVLLAPAGSDPMQVELLRSTLEGPLTQAGLRWEVRSDLDPFEAGLRLVFALPPDPGIADLASASPQVQFVAVNMPGIQPSANLSLVGGEPRFDQQGFLAGVIAAMLTPDWRVGVVSIADTPEGKAARNGFMNGAIYFCGLCQAYHGPIFDYPLYVEIPSGAGQADWQAAVDTLLSQAVKTVYVFPGAGEPSVLESLGQAGINIISSGAPPQNLSAQWIASIDVDSTASILEHLPDFLAGKGGLDITLPVVVRDVNPELFSPGRQKLAEEIRDQLLSGMIDTGIDPLTGDNR